MRKFTFLLPAVLSVLLTTAQHSHDADRLTCSKAKFIQEYYKSTTEIIQSPLLFDYDVKHYFIDITVHNNTIEVGGEVTFLAEVVAEELDTFAFELLDEMIIDEVTVNGVAQAVSRLNDEVFVALSGPLAAGEMFTANIEYHGTPPTGGFFSGISTSYDSWGKNVTWTLSEPFAARDWWPVKQVLDDKADSVWVFLTTEGENMAGSNGLLTNVVPLPDNMVRYEWKSNYPIAYYLISFAVSEYQEYNVYAHPAELQGDSVLIQNFIYDVPNCLETYKDGIDQTAGFIELFSDLYTLYPFHEEKYGHCLTDLGGGMEHQTMTTIGGFNFWLVAHELGHMWFGDNVTCATWSDIWINEGFATYSEYLALQYIQGQSAANGEMNNLHNSVMSQPGGSVYVPEDEVTYDNVWRIFDGRLSYNKGSVILHMIRYELDDDSVFFATLQNFQEQFADSTATGLDFMGVLNETSGMDFTQFFDQWYFGEGYPTFDITWSQDDAYLYMEVTQESSMPGVTPVFKMPVEYKFFFYAGGDTTVRLQQTDNVNTFMLPISQEVGLIQVDPNNWLLNKVGTITTTVKETLNPVAFNIAPNPVRNSLNLKFERQSGTEPYTLAIYSLDGTLVESAGHIESQLELDTHGLNPGTYFLRVTQGDRQFTEKFVKLEP